MFIFVGYKLTSLLRNIKKTRYLKWRGSPTPSGKLGSQSHLKLSCYTEDNYTVVKCVSPGVANLALNLRATIYQLYDPIQTTEPLQTSVSLLCPLHMLLHLPRIIHFLSARFFTLWALVLRSEAFLDHLNWLWSSLSLHAHNALTYHSSPFV